MKIHKNKFQRLTPVLLVTAGLWALCSAAPPADQAAQEISHRSIFVLPSSLKEGHDPFFPDSLRPYESAVVTSHSVEVTSLVFKGVSGPPNHRLVIINNHSFGAGDEGDVTTSQGRIHIRCVEIRADSVVIEASGQRVVLNFPLNP